MFYLEGTRTDAKVPVVFRNSRFTEGKLKTKKKKFFQGLFDSDSNQSDLKLVKILLTANILLSTIDRFKQTKVFISHGLITNNNVSTRPISKKDDKYIVYNRYCRCTQQLIFVFSLMKYI